MNDWRCYLWLNCSLNGKSDLRGEICKKHYLCKTFLQMSIHFVHKVLGMREFTKLILHNCMSEK